MKIYIERKIESERDLPQKEGTYFVHSTIGDKDIFNWTIPEKDNPVDEYWDMQFQEELWVDTFDYWLEPIEVDEGAEIGDILQKHNLTVDLAHNKAMTDRVYKAMQEYADIQVAKALDKPTSEDIEEWAKEQFMSKKDYSHLTEIQEAILICFKSGCSYGAKAALNGEIKKEQ